MKMCRLEFGAFGAVHVRHEEIVLGLPRPVRLLYASDLHLGHWWTRGVAAEIAKLAAKFLPDVVLLGGDLIDHRRALPALAELVRRLGGIAVVGAVPGNHDARVGLAEVRDAILSNGGHWLPAAPLTLGVRLDGVIQAEEMKQPGVLCTHHPALFPQAAAAGYRLVLAGHLHGGQCVLATHREKLYPAAWLHRWHGLRFRSGNSLMLVSRGLADTLPVRFNCPREVLLCDLA
jgi:uncharacterized protein